MKHVIASTVAFLACTCAAGVRAADNYVAWAQPVIAFTHAVVDGSGGKAACDPTLVIGNGLHRHHP